jgi:hypothetical protein
LIAGKLTALLLGIKVDILFVLEVELEEEVVVVTPN